MSERRPDSRRSDDPRTEEDRAPVSSAPPRWLAGVLIGVGILVVAVFVLLHLSGAVGPGAH